MRKLTLILVPLLLLACGREPAAPAMGGGPSFNWMNNPDNGNVRIARYGTDWAVSWTDPGTGLRATHTTYPIPVGNIPELDCGPQELLDPVDVQDVGLPDLNDFLATRFRSSVTGSLWIIVRDLGQPGDCYGATLVAQGQGNFRYTDNDVIAWYEGSTRRNDNAFGYMAQGSLTDVNGQTRRYSGLLRVVWDPQGDTHYTEKAQVTIR
jgi:hypothetical protein